MSSETLAIFFGAYIATKAQRDFFENQIERERQEIEELPQKETEEIRDIFGGVSCGIGFLLGRVILEPVDQ